MEFTYIGSAKNRLFRPSYAKILVRTPLKLCIDGKNYIRFGRAHKGLRENSLEKRAVPDTRITTLQSKVNLGLSKIMNVSWEELLDLEDSYVTKIHDIKGFGLIVDKIGNSKEAICPRCGKKSRSLHQRSLIRLPGIYQYADEMYGCVLIEGNLSAIVAKSHLVKS